MTRAAFESWWKETGYPEPAPLACPDEWDAYHARYGLAWRAFNAGAECAPTPTPVQVASAPRAVAAPGGSCCLMRRKVVVAVIAIHPESTCGVHDSEMASFLRFEGGQKVLAFAFCGWCGAPRGGGTEERVTPPPFSPAPGGLS